MLAGLPFLLLGLVALVWRFAGESLPWLGWTASGLALLAVLLLRRRDHADTAWAVAGAAAVAAMVALTRLMAWWPCQESCQGGAVYSRLLGTDIVILALVGAGFLLVLALWTRRRDSLGRRGLVLLLSWGLAGIGGYYLWLAWWLQLACPFCFAMHTALVAAALAATAWRSRPLPLAVSGALAFGLLHFLYHPEPMLLEPERSGNPVLQLGLRDEHLMVLMAADRGRRLGAAGAPVRAELVIDYQCEHCRSRLPPLLDGLRPALASGRLELVIRHRHAARDPGARHLARLSLAAAASGRLREQMDLMLGTKPGLRREEIDALLPPQLAGVQSLVVQQELVFDKLLDLERTELHHLAATIGRTPLLVLVAGGVERGRWADHIPVAEVLAAVAAP